MKSWKVYSAHENVVLGTALTLADARSLAQEWAETAGRCHTGYVPGCQIDASKLLITVIYREKGAAVCKLDGSTFHMYGNCMCEDGIIRLYDSKQAL